MKKIFLTASCLFLIAHLSFSQVAIIAGEDGKANQVSFMQAGTSTFYELIQFGKGGNAGNTSNTGGGGGYTLYNLSTSTLTTSLFTGTAKIPGGGGCGSSSRLGFGANANTGMVVIHY